MVNTKANEKKNSIVELEAEIEQIKISKDAKTKANAAKIKQLQSVLNKTYVEYKQKLISLEENNFSSLILLQSTRGFYKMFSHSLYFYVFNIAPKLNLDARVYSDGDYEAKSEAGVVSLKDIEALAKALAKLKIKRVKTKDGTGNLVVFKLPWDYTEKELEKFVEQNTYKLHKYNHIVLVENSIPVLYLNLNELLKVSYENVRRLEPVARETLGNMIVEISAEMIRIYIEFSNGRTNKSLGLKSIKNRLNKIKSQVKILADLKLWNARTYARVGEIIIKIQDILDLQMRDLENEQ